MNKSSRILPILVGILLLHLSGSARPDENDTPIVLHETAHFRLFIENPEKSLERSVEELGECLEILWKKLDEQVGKYCVRNPPEKTDPAKRKCNVFIFHHRSSYFETLHTLQYSDYSAARGLYDGKDNIYIHCRKHETLCVVLHEATHYYCAEIFPRNLKIYPSWFKEMLALFFSQYAWTDMRSKKNIPPPFFTEFWLGYAWKRFEKLDDANGKFEAKSIRELTHDKRFGDIIYTEKEVSEDYSIYFVLGRYFLTERQEVFQDILRNIGHRESFSQAFEKATKDNPVFIRDILRWIEKQSPSFEVVNGDWRSAKNGFEIKSSLGIMQIFCVTDRFPEIVVHRKHDGKTARTGIVINLIDNINFDVLEVKPDGEIVLHRQQNRAWTLSKRIRKADGHVDSYRWRAVRFEGRIDIHVNGEKVYSEYDDDNRSVGIFAEGRATFEIIRHFEN